MRATLAFVVACLAVFFAATESRAQAALTDNDFTVDLYEGPVLGPNRVVGMAGAYTALATGIDGSPWNPVGYGSRELYELDWFEWDLDIGLLVPGLLTPSKFIDSGAKALSFDDFVFFHIGSRFVFGKVGVGVLTRIRNFAIRDREGSADANVTFGLTNFGAAYQFFDGDLVVGAGARLATFDINTVSPTEGLVSEVGIGAEGGAVIRIDGEPWRVGLAVRSSVRSGDIEGDRSESTDGVARANGFVLPSEIYLPWEAYGGFAYQFGPKPFNRRWYVDDYSYGGQRQILTLARFKRERDQVRRELGGEDMDDDPYAWLPQRAQDPEWKRDEIMRREIERRRFEDEIADRIDAMQKEATHYPREYLLVAADVGLVGPTPRGVGLDAFLDQKRMRSGTEVSPTVRVGMESEVIPGWLQLRLGSYLEPSRVDPGTFRTHVTTGCDVRLFDWDLFGIVDEFTFRIGGSTDIAKDYLDWGLSIGMWH